MIRISIGIAAAGAMLAVAGTATAQSGVRGVSKSEIVVGMHTDLSGVAATWGIGSSNGIRMRFDEVNAAGGVHGRKIKLVVEDSQYQVPRAVQAANKLINRDRVFLMVGAIGTPMNNAVFKDQFAAGVPNMFPFTAARSMYEPFHPLKWSGTAAYYAQIRAAVKYFVEQRGKNRVCVLYQDTDFGQEILEGVRDQLQAMGRKIHEAVTNKPADTDFTAHITRLKGADCDLLAMGTIVRDTIIPYSTARKMGWNVDIVGTTASFDQAVAGAAGGITDGYYAMTQTDAPYADSDNPAIRQWVQRYVEKYKRDPNPAAQLGYVFADLVVVGLDRAGRNLTVDSFTKGMETVQGYKDQFGGPIMNFGPKKHHGTDQSFLTRVKGGKFVKETDNLSF